MHALIRALCVAMAAAACGDPVSGTTETTTTGTTTTGTTTTGTTGHVHPTEGASSTHATGHDTSASSGGEASPVAAYCACMVERCHDLYHSTWGEDHVAAEMMCEAAAAAAPMVGMPATEGDSLECRLHHCEAAATDIIACDSAIGGGACT